MHLIKPSPTLSKMISPYYPIKMKICSITLTCLISNSENSTWMRLLLVNNVFSPMTILINSNSRTNYKFLTQLSKKLLCNSKHVKHVSHNRCLSFRVLNISPRLLNPMMRWNSVICPKIQEVASIITIEFHLKIPALQALSPNLYNRFRGLLNFKTLKKRRFRP